MNSLLGILRKLFGRDKPDEGTRQFDIHQYGSLEEFRQAARAKRIMVSTQFSLGVSNIMRVHGLSFAETCELLEKRGYLIWAGGVIPLYNLAADKLWWPKMRKVVGEHKEQEPVSIYQPGDEISCVFFTLVIRNQALRDKYKGRLEAFVNKHRTSYNNDITVLIVMAEYDLDEAIEDIVKNGLKGKQDFVIFDASIYGFSSNRDYVEIPFNADWLRGYYSNGKTMVRYVPGQS